MSSARRRPAGASLRPARRDGHTDHVVEKAGHQRSSWLMQDSARRHATRGKLPTEAADRGMNAGKRRWAGRDVRRRPSHRPGRGHEGQPNLASFMGTSLIADAAARQVVSVQNAQSARLFERYERGGSRPLCFLPPKDRTGREQLIHDRARASASQRRASPNLSASLYVYTVQWGMDG